MTERTYKNDPEAMRQFTAFRQDVLLAEQRGVVSKDVLERAGTIGAFLEHAWQAPDVVAEARALADRALKLPSDEDLPGIGGLRRR